jgi:hypothetical protein
MRFNDEMPRMSKDWHWRLVRLWFKGYAAKDSNGIAYRAYLTGKYEAIAQSFFSRALMDSATIPYDVREMLSDAFEEDVHPSSRYPSHRKLQFVFRRRGNRVDGIRENDIFLKMQAAVSEFQKIEAAVSHLNKKHGLSRSEVLKVWGKWKQDSVQGLILDFWSNVMKSEPSAHIENYRQQKADEAKT